MCALVRWIEAIYQNGDFAAEGSVSARFFTKRSHTEGFMVYYYCAMNHLFYSELMYGPYYDEIPNHTKGNKKHFFQKFEKKTKFCRFWDGLIIFSLEERQDVNILA